MLAAFLEKGRKIEWITEIYAYWMELKQEINCGVEERSKF